MLEWCMAGDFHRMLLKQENKMERNNKQHKPRYIEEKKSEKSKKELSGSQTIMRE